MDHCRKLFIDFCDDIFLSASEKLIQIDCNSDIFTFICDGPRRNRFLHLVGSDQDIFEHRFRDEDFDGGENFKWR